MRHFTASIALFAGLTLGLPALSQEVVGTSVIDGQRVELLSDRTWRLAAERPAGFENCAPLIDLAYFCGLPSIWKPVDLGNPQFAGSYQYDSLHFGGFVAEPVGTEIGLSLDRLRAAVLDNISRITGLRVEDIPILSVEPIEIDGEPGETVTYLVAVNGLDFAYINSMVVREGLAFQAMTWTVGESITVAHERIHAEMIEQTRLIDGL